MGLVRRKRIWGGIGLILLGLVIGVVTFISIMGPVLGLILMAVGMFLIGWAINEESPRTPPSRS